MYRLVWGKQPPPKSYFVGRNGLFECTGVQIGRDEDIISITPLCKQKGTPANCLIEIPISHLGGLINALKDLQ